MNPMGFVLVGGFVIFSSIWWLLQQFAFRLCPSAEQDEANVRGSLSNVIKLVSGLGASILIVAALGTHGLSHYIKTLTIEFWCWLAAGVLLNIFIAHFFIKASEKSVASVAVHVTALAPIIAIATGYFINHELPGGPSIGGILVILFGLYVLHFNPKQYGWRLGGPFVEIWQKRGNWLNYALAFAVCAGFAIPIDKKLVELSDRLIAPGLVLVIAWGLFWGSVALRNRDFKKISSLPQAKLFPILLILGLCLGIANGFIGASWQYGPAATIGTLKRVEAILVVMMAWIFLTKAEKKTGNFICRLVGALVVFGGVVLIAVDK